MPNTSAKSPIFRETTFVLKEPHPLKTGILSLLLSGCLLITTISAQNLSTPQARTQTPHQGIELSQSGTAQKELILTGGTLGWSCFSGHQCCLAFTSFP